MKKKVYYLLMSFTGILLISCGKDEPEPQPELLPQTVAVSSVMLNKTTLDMEIGASETLTAEVTPQNATNKAVVWSSSKGTVATVDNAGKVTALSAGVTTITVITADGGKVATCTVTVEAEKVEPKYYAAFRFDGKDYRIANDNTCIFTKHSDEYYVVNCSDTVKKHALSISIAKKLEKGKSYDIYSGSIYVMTSIQLLFTAGEDIAEESFWTDDMAQTGVIGSLAMSELTDELLSGTFRCRTMNGEITEGRFHVKAREWD